MNRELAARQGIPSAANERLRAAAEEMVKAGAKETTGAVPTDVLGLIHELRVHQVELELQSEELRQTQFALEVALQRYNDLYDFAPVGYVTLGTDGKILEANLTFADMLGVTKRYLNGRALARFISVADQQTYLSFRGHLLSASGIETCEVRLLRSVNEPFWARLEAIKKQDDERADPVWTITVSDIQAEKQAEEKLKGLTQVLEQRVKERTRELYRRNLHLLDEIERHSRAEALLRNRGEWLEQRVEERTRELSTLLDISHHMATVLELDQLAAVVLDQIQTAIDNTACALLALAGDDLIVLDYRGPCPQETALRLELPVGDAVGFERCIRSREAVRVVDLQGGGPLAVQWQQQAHPAQRELMGGARSWLAVPVAVKDRVLGVLTLMHDEENRFTPRHEQMALSIASQAAVAAENAQLYEQAQLLAALEERQRLAHELHDTVAQTFYGIALSVHRARAALGKDNGLVVQAMDHILRLSDAGLTEMRALVFDLKPEALRSEGLVNGLRKQLAALRARNDLEVQVDVGAEPDASFQAKEIAYRIAQAALNNVVKHASAKHVQIRLNQIDSTIYLEVSDDGIGFDANRNEATLNSLRAVQDKLSALGGALSIESTPGKGTHVRAEIPAIV